MENWILHDYQWSGFLASVDAALVIVLKQNLSSASINQDVA